MQTQHGYCEPSATHVGDQVGEGDGRMAWIASDQSVDRDTRTLRLARLLDVDRRFAQGLLHEIWHWALDNVPPDGSLTHVSVDDIGLAIDWPKPAALSHALQESGWITGDDDGPLHLAEWWHIGGKFQEARQREAERMRLSRAANVRRTLDARAENVRRTFVGREPKRTTEETPSRVSSSRRGVQGGFGERAPNVPRTEMPLKDDGTVDVRAVLGLDDEPNSEGE